MKPDPASTPIHSTIQTNQAGDFSPPPGPALAASSNRISALAKAKNKTSKNIVERPDTLNCQ